MPTIHRQSGLRFAILTDDYEPAHIHVFGEGETRIRLGEAGEAPVAVHAAGSSLAESAKAMAVVAERQPEFLRRWAQIHRDGR